MIVLNLGTENTVTASSLRLTPSLTFSELYDDNVFLVRENRTSDYVSIVEPQLRVSSSVGEISRSIQYRAQVERYAKTSGLNTVNHFSDLDWRTRLTKSTTLTVSDHFSFTSDSTEISTLGVAVPRGDVYSNASVVGLQLSRLALLYQYGLQGFEAAELSDNQSHTFQGQIGLPLSAHYEFTQSYRLRYYVQDNQVDLRSHTVGTGLRYRLSPSFMIGLEGGVAYWRTSTDDSFRTGPMVRVDLEKSFRRLRLNFTYLEDIRTQFQGSVEYGLRRTVLRLNYSRELTAGGGVLKTATDRQTASVNLQQGISRRADLNLTAGYSTSRPIERNQDRFKSYRGAVAFSYVIRPWLRGAIRYNYFKQDSDDTAQQEFKRHQGILSLTFTMP
jgi:hypothetical protein